MTVRGKESEPDIPVAIAGTSDSFSGALDNPPPYAPSPSAPSHYHHHHQQPQQYPIAETIHSNSFSGALDNNPAPYATSQYQNNQQYPIAETIPSNSFSGALDNNTYETSQYQQQQHPQNNVASPMAVAIQSSHPPPSNNHQITTTNNHNNPTHNPGFHAGVRRNLGRDPTGIQCPYCQRQTVTMVKDQLGACTVVAIIVLLFVFWPIAWLPLCMPSCKQTNHYCAHQECRRKVGETEPCA